MQLQVARRGKKISVTIVGSIGEPDISDIVNVLQSIEHDSVQKVVLNLLDVPTVSSAGIGILVTFQHRLQKNGRELQIRGCHDNLIGQFKSIHLDKVIRIAP